MADNFQKSLEFVLRQEGGFANLKNDEITNLGVKKSTWEEYVGHPVSVDDIKRLKVTDVAPLYFKEYYKKALCDVLVYPFSVCVFDFSVHSGVDRATKTLSKVLGVEQQKKQELVNKANASNQADLTNRYIDARESFLKTLANFKYYGKGWLSRTERLRKHVLGKQ